MAGVAKTKRDGTLTIRDATAVTPLEITFTCLPGDLTLDIPGPTVVTNLHRGKLTSPPCLRFGDDQALSGSFTAVLRDVSATTAAVLNDIITNSGIFASTWVSTLGADAEVKTVEIEWATEGTDHGEDDYTTTMAYCWSCWCYRWNCWISKWNGCWTWSNWTN